MHVLISPFTRGILSLRLEGYQIYCLYPLKGKRIQSEAEFLRYRSVSLART